MTGAVRIVVDGAPVAKGRPKIGRLHNGRPVAFTPAKTRRFEDVVRLAAGQAMDGREPMGGPVSVRVAAYLPIPASWSGKKQRQAEEGLIVPTTRPDVDNYVKAALDAINTIVVRDDSQVALLEAAKFYDRRPRLEIDVEMFAVGRAA